MQLLFQGDTGNNTKTYAALHSRLDSLGRTQFQNHIQPIIRQPRLGQTFFQHGTGARSLFARDEGELFQTLERNLFQLGQRTIGRENNHQFVFDTRPQNNIFIVYRPFHHPQINGSILQFAYHHAGIVYSHTNLNFGKLFVVTTQNCGQKILTNGSGSSQLDDASNGASHFVDGFFRFTIQLQNSVSILKHCHARLSERDAVTVTIKQPGIKMFFQLPYLKGHGWLSQIQLLGRSRKRQMP